MSSGLPILGTILCIAFIALIIRLDHIQSISVVIFIINLKIPLFEEEISKNRNLITKKKIKYPI